MANAKSAPAVETRKLGPTLEAHQIVIAPIVSEKVTHLVERRNTYAFQVHKLATKAEIKAAVEKLFEVRVLDVRTQNRQGKVRRARSGKGRQASWKKAYVTLPDEHRISLF